MTDTACVRNLNLLDGKTAGTDDLSGRAVRLAYASGHILEQHWQSPSRITWKGIAGSLAGYDQSENYIALPLGDGVYLVTWIEASTTTATDGPQVQGPWLTDVIIDFNRMRATASWIGPRAGGDSEHVIDEAVMTLVPCDPA